MRKRLNPAEPAHLAAVWWLPDRPDVVIPGSLVLVPGQHASIDIHGALPDAVEIGTHEVLWGYVGSRSPDLNHAVTVHRALRTNERSITGRVAHTSTTSIGISLLEGSHVPPPTVDRVSAFRVLWRDADEWLGTRLVAWSELGRAASELEFPPDGYLQRFRVEAADAWFAIHLETTTHLRKGERRTLRDVWWELEFDSPQPMAVVHERLVHLRDFAWLAYDQAVEAKAVRVRFEAEPDAPADERPEWHTVGANVVFRPGPEDTRHGPHMPLGYGAVAGSLDTIVNAWFASRGDPERGGAFTGWRAVIERAGYTVEQALNERARFLDGFLPNQRRLGSGAWKRVRRQLTQALDDADGLSTEQRDAMKTRLGELNRRAFGERVRAALERVPDAVRETWDLDDALVGSLVGIRNTLAHGGTPDSRAQQDLYRYESRVRMLALAITMLEIGVPPDQLHARLKVSPRGFFGIRSLRAT